MIRSPLVRDALALRSHALALFFGAIDAEEFVRVVSSTSLESWRFVLGAEACATPLRTRLGIAAQTLSPNARALLDRACATELQRMLAAQMQLALIDRAAAAALVSPIVLKGGVPIAEGKHAFDLGDIDLLVAGDEAQKLEQALVALGADRRDGLRFPGTLTTEIHDKLDAGAGVSAASDVVSAPLSRFKRLRRLKDVPHAAYIIQHCTTHHVERRGNLRDLALLADAIRDMEAAELDALRVQLEALPDRELYQRFLMNAIAISRGDGPIDDPDTARVMAAHYVLCERWPKDTGFIPLTLRQMTTFLLGNPRDLTRAVRLYLLNPIPDDSRWMMHPLATRLPRLSRFVSYIVRTPYRLGMLAYAASVAVRFRLDYDRP